MKLKLLTLLLALSFAPITSPAADSLERGFAQPPDSTKPWCYWYWITDNISREGITKDLEAMKRVGISEAFIGNIYLDEVKHGTREGPDRGMVGHGRARHPRRRAGGRGHRPVQLPRAGASRAGRGSSPSRPCATWSAPSGASRARCTLRRSCRRPASRSRTSPCWPSPRRRATPTLSPPIPRA